MVIDFILRIHVTLYFFTELILDENLYFIFQQAEIYMGESHCQIYTANLLPQDVNIVDLGIEEGKQSISENSNINDTKK